MILRIFPFLLLLLLLPVFVADRLWLRKKVKGLWRGWAYLPGLVLTVLLSYAAFNEQYTPAADLFKQRLLTATLLVAVPHKLALLVLALLYLPLRQRPRSLQLSVAFSFFLALGVLTYGFFWGFKRVVVTPYRCEVNRLPKAFEGYRIVQLSDLHIGTLRAYPEVVERVVDSVNAQQPDLIVFTGDLVNYHSSELRPFLKTLSRLKARDGIVSIMGNHDYLTYHKWQHDGVRMQHVKELQSMQREMGWNLLLNAHTYIHRGADSLLVVGLENDGYPRFTSLANYEKATRGARTDDFHLVLQHDPSYWRRALLPKGGENLMLAGHTHAMQFRIGSFSPSQWLYPEWGGAYKEGRQTLFVSVGAGEVMLPFRFGAWPEVVCIDLFSNPQFARL